MIIVAQLVKKFSDFSETYYCVHNILQLDPILSQMNPVHILTYSFLRSTLILSSHPLLGLPSGVFASRLSTKILYVSAFLISPMRAACPAHFISPLDLIALIGLFGEELNS
jgi:hypothetical protein